ncbi:MAG TPA: PEPxxWA-CTERM sorting domain-containing protein [Caulobacteraceae bacterium]|nr:PEPxxWA-CTERM sorting domain-containing protein [Caulobacteraceae bacterium]
MLGFCVGSGIALAAVGASAAPTVAPGYTLSVFAGPLAGSSAPDSITSIGSDVFVGYGNGGAPDGSGGATSTIAEYTNKGALLGQITVVGHNDGLRYDAQTGKLWAVQNEDGNPNLVLITPSSLAASAPLSFSSTPHGGGYDDVAFGPNGTYVSASNPANNPNTAPAIVSVSLTPSQVVVNSGGVLAGNTTASVINPGGGTTTLNLQDPDSMIFAPDGRLVLDSQADQQLVFVSNPGGAGQSVSVLNLVSTVDDTEFTGANAGRQRLLFTDADSGTVYALTGAFGAGQAISAADTLSEIVNVNQTDGSFTALVSGLDSPHGEALTAAVPEPATWAVMLAGFCGLGAVLRVRRKSAVAAA